MSSIPAVTVAITAAALLYVPAIATAQSTQPAPPHVHLEKTIGQNQATKAQVFPSLIVMNSRGASLQGGKLTLTGIAPNSIVSPPRPVTPACRRGCAATACSSRGLPSEFGA